MLELDGDDEKEGSDEGEELEERDDGDEQEDDEEEGDEEMTEDGELEHVFWIHEEFLIINNRRLLGLPGVRRVTLEVPACWRVCLALRAVRVATIREPRARTTPRPAIPRKAFKISR
jgi:hypothetical protein